MTRADIDLARYMLARRGAKPATVAMALGVTSTALRHCLQLAADYDGCPPPPPERQPFSSVALDPQPAPAPRRPKRLRVKDPGPEIDPADLKPAPKPPPHQEFIERGFRLLGPQARERALRVRLGSGDPTSKYLRTLEGSR
jgi:hypothetical protein